MVWASYKAPSQSSQLNNRRGDRDAALSAEPDPSRRGHCPWHSPSSQATPLAMVNPGQPEEAWQGEGSGDRLNDVPRLLRWRNRADRRRRRRQRRRRRGKRYLRRRDELGQRERERGLAEQGPRASSSNNCGRQGGQRGSAVHGPRREQPGEACWQGHGGRNQQQQRTGPLNQDQEGEQSSGGQEESLFWNVKKCCWAKILHVPAATLREEIRRLRPMNMAGYCLPGMVAPHNTSQYIMDQHEYTWINEGEVAGATSGVSSNCSTADEDRPLVVPLPSTAQNDEGTSAEEEEESTQPACQH